MNNACPSRGKLRLPNRPYVKLDVHRRIMGPIPSILPLVVPESEVLVIDEQPSLPVALPTIPIMRSVPVNKLNNINLPLPNAPSKPIIDVVDTHKIIRHANSILNSKQ